MKNAICATDYANAMTFGASHLFHIFGLKTRRFVTEEIFVATILSWKTNSAHCDELNRRG